MNASQGLLVVPPAAPVSGAFASPDFESPQLIVKNTIERMATIHPNLFIQTSPECEHIDVLHLCI
jgi:hypothetical protein